jgi:hypothetical protein
VGASRLSMCSSVRRSLGNSTVWQNVAKTKAGPQAPLVLFYGPGPHKRSAKTWRRIRARLAGNAN